MSRQQRLTFLAVAVVIAVVAIVLLAGGEDEEPATTAAEPTATAQATGTSEPEEASPAEATPTPEPKPPLLTAADPRTVRVEQGERVEFRVRHDVADEVHVHGYDVYKDLQPGKVATISFKADLTGIWEVELHDAVKPLGQLRVEPR